MLMYQERVNIRSWTTSESREVTRINNLTCVSN